MRELVAVAAIRQVSDHYARQRPRSRRSATVCSDGQDDRTVTIDDLAPVDEFHIGGRKRDRGDFCDRLEPLPADLD